MKFHKVNNPKFPWPKEKYLARIADVESDIINYSQQDTNLEKWIDEIRSRQRKFRRLISDKDIYLNQLRSDVAERFPENDSDPVNL